MPVAAMGEVWGPNPVAEEEGIPPLPIHQFHTIYSGRWYGSTSLFFFNDKASVWIGPAGIPDC